MAGGAEVEAAPEDPAAAWVEVEWAVAEWVAAEAWAVLTTVAEAMRVVGAQEVQATTGWEHMGG